MDIEAEVEAVQQWPRDPPAITIQSPIRASARRRSDAFTTWAGVHSGDEEEVGRHLDARLGPGDPDHPFLEGLT